MNVIAHSRHSAALSKNSRLVFKIALGLLTLAVTGIVAANAIGVSAVSIRGMLFGAAISDPIGLANEATLPASLANGALETPRTRHTATRLSDGRVLIVGGDASGSSETYDSVTGISSPSGYLGAARSGHTATGLADGRILISGGSVGGSAVASTEIYDPANGTFSPGPAMTSARAAHTATTLSNGNILVAGGGSDSAEIFDGTSFTSITAAMTASRTNASAIRMNDGRIFIAGGDGLQSAEIFNPADSTFAPVGNAMTVARVRALLRLLPDGKIQIIGGGSDGSMEVYDPAIDTIGAYAHVVPASDPCANLINHVLRAETRAALIFNGSSDPTRDRSGHTIAELGDTAVVIGGTDGAGNPTSTITVFNSSTATVTTDKLDYSPGETVLVTGAGYDAGETVRVMIHEDPHTEFERGFDAVADASGNFAGDYLVQDYDLGMKFIVGARGLTSGRTAQTTFTDARNWNLPFAGTGSGSVTLTPSTGTINAPVSCGGTGTNAASQTVTSSCAPNITTSANGAVVTFSALANPGSNFAGWSLPNLITTTCVGTTNPCTGTFTGNGSLTVTFNANTNTSTAVASSANPSVFGQSVTLTATVTRTTGAGSPTGTVQFVIDGSNFGSPVALVSATSTTSTAATSTSSLSVGSHTVSATYIPTGGFNASSGSLSPSQVVNKANTTTTITSDHLNPLAWTQITPSGTGPSTSTCGQSTVPDGNGRLIVYARTTCGGGIGQVWVLNGANGVGSPSWSLVASGGPSRHAQTVTYDKISNRLMLFGGCSGGCLPVNNDVWVLTNANGQGGPAVWTSLATTGGPPAARNHATGAYDPATNRMIIFGGQNGSGVVVGATFSDVWVLTNANGIGGTPVWTSLATSGIFPKGVYQARAFYDSTNNRLTVAGGARSDTGAASSAVNVLTNANGLGGTPAWTNLIAEGAAGAPAFAGWNVDYNAGVNRGILAVQSTSNLYYLNNANGLGGPTSYTLVSPSGGGGAVPGYGLGFDAPTGRTMAWHQGSGTNRSYYLAPASSSIYGESVTFTANVSVNAPGAGTPSGTVQFYAGVMPIGGAQPVVGGMASVPTSTLVVGSHNITAVYSGDTNFTGSSSGILTHLVSKAATTTTVISTPNPSVYGDSVTFTSTTLSGVSPVGEGSVSYYEGGTCAAPGTLLFAAASVQSLTGEASFNMSTLNAGSHTVIACYSATNYSESTGSVVHVVNKRSLTVTADDQSIVYGNPAPSFTFQYGTEFVLGDDAGDVDVAPTCTVTGAHVNVSTYPIVCSGGSDNNYQFNFVNGTLTIDPATLNVNAVANTKIYGDADSAFSHTLSGFKFSENETSAGVTGSASCSRTAGETVAGSPYTITCAPGTLAAANYIFATGTTANFTITPATLSVNAVANTKEYGDADPAFSYTLSGFKFSENETSAGVTGSASCSRTAGETVAGSPYTITCAPGTLAAANYIFAPGTTANFTITPATLNVNALANTKIYGDADPAFSYTLSGFKFSENEVSAGVTGVGNCSRTAGEAVAGSPYTITCAPGTLAAANYIFATGATASFTINQRPATWTTDPASKTYGDPDPSPLTTGSGSNFVAADNVTATYSRVAGENASPPTYHITATLSATPLSVLDNYIITNDGAEFTINKRLATWTTDPNSKTYGDADPVPLTTGSGSNFVAADNVTASYTRVAGENASPPTYHITASLSAAAGVLGNYIVTNTGAEFTINKRALTITAQTNTKTYDGNTSALAAPIVAGLQFSDTVTGLSETYDNRNAGTGKTLSVATYTVNDGNAGNNYNVTTVSNTTGVIIRAALTVTAVANMKTYDGTTSAAAAPTVGGLISPDSVTGLSETYDTKHFGTGKTMSVATYTVNDGNAGGNYDVMTVQNTNGVINKAPLTITALTNTKTYDGNITAAATPTVAGTQTGDTVTGLSETYYTKHFGTGKIMSVATYTVNDGNSGNNYNVSTVPNNTGVINKLAITVTAFAATKAFDGNTSSSGIPTITPSLVGGDISNFVQTYDTPFVGTGKTLIPSGTANDGNAGANYSYTFVPVNTGVITTIYCFNGFLSPIGGSVEGGNGGTYTNPVRAFKLASTIPIKFILYAAGCSGSPIVTGVHTLQITKYTSAVDSDPAIDATPTDSATTGNQFRLTGTEWHYNLNTKTTPGISAGTWLVKATLLDGSTKTVWISIKK